MARLPIIGNLCPVQERVMNVFGKHYRTVWLKEDDPSVVQIIDQRYLPFEFVIEDLRTHQKVGIAIRDMHARGAGLIGAVAGYGMYLAALNAPKESSEAFMRSFLAAGKELIASRPTAVNLEWAVRRQIEAVSMAENVKDKVDTARQTAQAIADEDADYCRRIGEHGVGLIEDIYQKKGSPVNVLTHCNAGWLAFVDYGSATAPIYAAHERGIPVHVWVDETRPRNQGARLTLWELEQHGVPNTLIVDNAGGHLMQHGMVDLVITGTDRTTFTGDVGNKIGTYLKALAAFDNGIPFYTALPSSTFDWNMKDGVQEIPVEERDQTEVRCIEGFYEGKVVEVLLTTKSGRAANYAFDVTPARLVTGLITERGICKAAEKDILALFPEKKK
jgi:methylthioribose-1-phosphate isomerase